MPATTTAQTGLRGLRALLRTELRRVHAAARAARAARYVALRARAVAAHLAAHPWSRASGATCWDSVGSAQRIARCVICGATHSESGKWGPTQHMAAWRNEHAHHSAATLRESIRDDRREADERALWRRYDRPATQADRRATASVADLGLPATALAPLASSGLRPVVMAVLARRGPLARVVLAVGRPVGRHAGRAVRRWIEISVAVST